MADSYELTTIADLLKVPTDRREACVLELLKHLESLEFIGGEEAKLDLPVVLYDDGQVFADFTLTTPSGQSQVVRITHES